MIEQLGKGAIPQPKDDRDFRAEPIFGVPVVDWTKEFRLEEPPDENQNGSLSCVAQSWSYYHWQLNRQDWSRRSLYSRIFLPQGGAYLRDGGKELTSRGQATRDEAPDPVPQTETEMRKRDDITIEEEGSDIEQGYFAFEESNIDYYAVAIRDYQGIVFGVRGTNKAWADMTNPKVPTDNDYWYHAIYGMGFHLHDGQKCVIAKSSWAGAQPGHHEHHIKEDYFTSGGTFNNWVLIPKEIFMSNAIFIHKAGTAEYGYYLPAMSEDALKDKAKNLGLSIVKPDGQIDYAKAKEVQGL